MTEALGNPGASDVSYQYGPPRAPFNRAGRIVQVHDQGGSEERFYGKLGEVVKEIKTIASHTQGNSANSPEVWTTEYLFDTFGRLQRLVYPDGEVLSYAYDPGAAHASSATFPPAAVVLIVTVCSAQKRVR